MKKIAFTVAIPGSADSFLYDHFVELVKEYDVHLLANFDNYDRSLVKQITEENAHIFSQIATGKVEARWCKTVDGKDLHSWVIYPTHFFGR